MLTFGWGEILIVFFIVIVFVGPKELPNLIKQLSLIIKSITKLSNEFKISLREIAHHEDLDDAKSVLNEVNKIKNDLTIEDNPQSENETTKETSDIIDKKILDSSNNIQK